jgi:UDP-N-acetylglucosamine/UDP-N-acetylgalactosamine diphosphorylase
MELQNQIKEKHDFLPINEGNEHLVNLANLSASERERYERVGFEALGANQVGAIILSGGQGTRLGFHGPKGMYSIGLPSGKTIFQLHIERILKIRQLTAKLLKKPMNQVSIPIYIMTSNLNHEMILDYFLANHYFSYPPEDIIFFEQGLEPCFTFNGEVIIESPTSLSLAPDGNGGIYKALLQSGAIDNMTSRGTQYLHIYGIDNILTKSLDPIFLGINIAHNIECGNKVVWRANKAEKVGVTVETDGKMQIIEYSEIPGHLAESINPTNNKLLYGAANICNHFMNVPFLKTKVIPNLSGIYHLANKKIPFYDFTTNEIVTPKTPNGVKLEMFIFDIFPLASRWMVVETNRQDEFAPVKNEPGNPSDSPDTARAMISNQAVRWLEQAGAKVLSTDLSNHSNNLSFSMLPLNSPYLCEISPIVSYGGEGLEQFNNKTLNLPVLMN